MRRSSSLLLVLAVVVASAVAWRMREHFSRGADAALAASASAGASGTAPDEAWDGGAITRTTHDRRIRDELRRRIIESLLLPLDGGPSGTESPPPEPATGVAPLAPRAYGENDPLDREYIQHVMREDLFPLARQCFEQLLERQPDAGGRVNLHFGIVGDAKLGGYVDETAIDAGAPEDIQDPEMQTCMRESMNSIAFAPPKKGGAVTVDYPIEFAP